MGLGYNENWLQAAKCPQASLDNNGKTNTVYTKTMCDLPSYFPYIKHQAIFI